MPRAVSPRSSVMQHSSIVSAASTKRSWIARISKPSQRSLTRFSPNERSSESPLRLDGTHLPGKLAISETVRPTRSKSVSWLARFTSPGVYESLAARCFPQLKSNRTHSYRGRSEVDCPFHRLKTAIVGNGRASCRRT